MPTENRVVDLESNETSPARWGMSQEGRKVSCLCWSTESYPKKLGILPRLVRSGGIIPDSWDSPEPSGVNEELVHLMCNNFKILR